PMLLIPFVENAFKHGISLEKPSFIRVTLTVHEGSLFLDVHNSIHQRSGEDTEKMSNGIGLVNVQKRLELLYPNRHELIIRPGLYEYFIHLTIQLN
ncbi:MAG: GHKL domain-containing protein, partial [Chitinophagaceae bacterium]|nr:GHKL domain-containing protein [Chitinophagaceae bacterium]